MLGDVIRAKLAPPPLSGQLLRRPRLERTLLDAIEAHTAVWLGATAGAGKTTAVAQAAAASPRRLAWLSLDEPERAPGRLLVYLAAALERVVPEVGATLERAFAAEMAAGETAGLLAEATDGTPLLLVVDELERLAGAPAALETLGTLVRYAPPSLRLVLVSRDGLPVELGWLASHERSVALDERTLSFTVPEAAGALAIAGGRADDAAEAVAATGGWVTGVLFEAWRSTEHVAGTGGEADPLHGYLASEILVRLDEPDREFLVATALLDRVTPSRAEALGLESAGERLHSLRRRRLPVAWEPDGGMRAHPRFREYLVTCLERRGGDDVRALRRAHGLLLHGEGHGEEATEQLLRAGEPELAVAVAEHVVERVVERLDFPVAERWLGELGDAVPAGLPGFTSAALMLAIARERFHDVRAIVDRVAAAGALEGLVTASGRVAGLLGYAYWQLGRLDELRALLRTAPPHPEMAILDTVVRQLNTEVPSLPGAHVPANGGPLDARLPLWYAAGHLREPEPTLTSVWAAEVSSIWRAATLRATGRLEQAHGLYREIERRSTNPGLVTAIVGPELLADMGRHDEALELVRRGRAFVVESGSVVYTLASLAAEAKLELRQPGEEARGSAALAQLEAHPRLRDYCWIAEQADTWAGLSLLRRGCDRAARERLADAVERMRAADRILELPTAAVYWSEAASRLGDEAAAERAAEIARAAAERQGSTHILLQALAEFPAVLSRRVADRADPADPWHELARALDPDVATTIYLRQFGAPAILANGREVRPRLRKAAELLHYLVDHPTGRVDRTELLEALFDGRTDPSARAYLRQTIRRLREALPGDGVLAADTAGVRLERSGALSESRRCEELLGAAARQSGAPRLHALTRALELYDRGDYLARLGGTWADERRRALAELAEDARLDAAELALELGRHRHGEALVRSALAGDPYRERGWRLALRLARETGDEDDLLAVYRDCCRALAELRLEPSEATRALLDSLRATRGS